MMQLISIDLHFVLRISHTSTILYSESVLETCHVTLLITLIFTHKKIKFIFDKQYLITF